MTPRARFALTNALAAGLLAGLAFVAIGVLSGAELLSWRPYATLSFAVAPAAAMAAWLAAWWGVGWWQGLDGATRAWTPSGMALRIVVLALLLFAPLSTLWIAGVEAVGYLLGAAPASFAETMAWVPPIAVYATLFGVVLGFVPALCVEYVLCRRYMRLARAGGASP